MNDSRERTVEALKDALDEETKTKALFRAAEFTLRMRGGTTAIPNGAIPELLRAADDRGSLTGEEIADILDTDEIPVDYSSSWAVGD